MTYRLRDFGSYTAGGRIDEVRTGAPRTVQFTRSASYEIDPRGHFAIEHAYVQFFVPEPRNNAPPVVLVHGGGMAGSTWETTPDGRPGWLQLLLARGYEVHVVDNVERGRAGFAPDRWEGKPVLRSLEEAWTLFRIGSAEGFATRTPFPGQKFPTRHFDPLARLFVPRWLHTTPLQVAALVEVLQKTGPATLICHSQGGEVVFDAQALTPDNVVNIIALEPSGFPADIENLGQKPVTLVAGDYLDTALHWQNRAADWATLANNAANITLLDSTRLGPGHSHMLMMDADHERLLDIVLEATAST